MPLQGDGSSQSPNRRQNRKPKPIGMGNKRAGKYYNSYLKPAQIKRLKKVSPGLKRQRMRARMLKNSGIDLAAQKRTRRDVRGGKYSNYGLNPSTPGVSAPRAPSVEEEIQNSLPVFEQLDFENLRSNAEADFGRQLAENEFDRGLLAIRRDQQINDLTRNFRQNRMKFDPAFAGRGLFHSGLRTRAHRLHSEARDRGLGDIATEWEQGDSRYGLVDQNLNDALADALARIDVEEQTRRGQYLSALEAQENPYA